MCSRVCPRCREDTYAVDRNGVPNGECPCDNYGRGFTSDGKPKPKPKAKPPAPSPKPSPKPSPRPKDAVRFRNGSWVKMSEEGAQVAIGYGVEIQRSQCKRLKPVAFKGPRTLVVSHQVGQNEWGIAEELYVCENGWFKNDDDDEMTSWLCHPQYLTKDPGPSFQLGQYVRFSRNCDDEEMAGRIGKVTQWDKPCNRTGGIVSVDVGDPKYDMEATPFELRKVDILPEGTKCKVVGLDRHAEMNGLKGRILEFDLKKGKYHVQLEEKRTWLNIDHVEVWRGEGGGSSAGGYPDGKAKAKSKVDQVSYRPRDRLDQVFKSLAAELEQRKAWLQALADWLNEKHFVKSIEDLQELDRDGWKKIDLPVRLERRLKKLLSEEMKKPAR